MLYLSLSLLFKIIFIDKFSIQNFIYRLFFNFIDRYVFVSFNRLHFQYKIYRYVFYLKFYLSIYFI